MRRTKPVVKVGVALMSRPNDRHWGYELSKESGVASGVMYPLLTRMLKEGWLTDGWELGVKGQRPRRYYELTDKGRSDLGALLRTAQTDARFRDLNLGWAP